MACSPIRWGCGFSLNHKVNLIVAEEEFGDIRIHRVYIDVAVHPIGHVSQKNQNLNLTVVQRSGNHRLYVLSSGDNECQILNV